MIALIVAGLAAGAPCPHPARSPAASCEVPAPASLDSLMAERRFWHASRLVRLPPGTRPLPAESVLVHGLIAEGMNLPARVDSLLRRARGGDSLPEFIALAARADERGQRWRAAAAKYRRLLDLADVPPQLVQAAAARLAVALQQAGDREGATAAWRRAAVEVPEIADWFAIRRASLERDTAVAFAAVSGGRTPGAVQRSELLIAQRRLEAGNRQAALESFRRQARALDLARAELSLGRRREARARADSMLFADPTRPNGFLAAQFLSSSFDTLSVAENVAISRAYRARRDLRTAERFARAAIIPRDTSVEAWLELGRVLAERRMDVAARRAMDSAGARAGRSRAPITASARVLVLTLLGRQGEADSLLGQLVRVYRGDTSVARALLTRADRHRSLSERVAEETRYETMMRYFPLAPASLHAAFRLGLMRYVEGNRDSAQTLVGYSLARDSLRSLGTSARYWHARLRFERGDTGSVAVLRRIAAEAPITFHGTRALELLGDTAFFVDTVLSPPPLGSFPAARARERIRLLATLGFEAEARVEAVAWALDTSASVQVLLAAAAEAGEHGYARESITLGEAARARVGMLPAVARALFPFPYRALIEAEALEHCVDPLLMAAIIRQESRFDPNAVSVANARGLSQVWTPTGREMTQRLRLGAFNADMLHVPDFNLHLGTRYVQDRTVRDSFPVHALVASYNAGPGRVGRWRRWPEYADPDLFVERVTIPETQNYVRIVYASHAWYRAAWSGPPAPPQERPLSPLP